MTAFVVSVPRPKSAGTRVSIFPGSATPAVVAATRAFWIGYGFVSADELKELEPGTRFELEVDGRPVSLETDVEIEDGRPVGKVSVASFPAGLDAGWHRFVGRWYDAGALTLTSDRWIEFVER